MIPALAKEPISLTTLTCIIFHAPKLVMSDPLTYTAILSLSDNDSTSVPSDIIQALYLRHERDTQDAHIHRFEAGDIACLQRDVGVELRAVLKLWVELWKKEAVNSHYADTNGSNDDEERSIDLDHLQWLSRIANGLRDELFLLGTAQRRQDYVSTISNRRVEVPVM